MIKQILQNSLNTVKIVPLKGNEKFRADLLTKMLDTTYDYFLQKSNTIKKRRNIDIVKIRCIIEKNIPGINFKLTPVNVKNLSYALLLASFNKDTFAKVGYNLFLSSASSKINLNSNVIGLLMHEITHLYEQVLNPKLFRTYNKMLKAHNGNTKKAIKSVKKWNKLYNSFVYRPDCNYSNKPFKINLKEALDNANLSNNYERIQYLKEFYLHLKMEQRAYLSNSKYSYQYEKQARVEYNHLHPDKNPKPMPKKSTYDSKFDNAHSFREKLDVIKEELNHAIKLEKKDHS